MCSINNTTNVQQLNELQRKLQEINEEQKYIKEQIKFIERTISLNVINTILNECSDDIITCITKFLSSHSIANLYNTSKLFRIRIKKIYLIIVFKFKFDPEHNYRKIKTHLGMNKFACVFPLQYMKTHNIHIHYILANIIHLYDSNPEHNKLHFKNNINIEEYSQITQLYKILVSFTPSKKITFENYKQFLCNYDIRYSSQNNDERIKHFIDICKFPPGSNYNEFYYFYNHLKIFVNKYVPSIKSGDFRRQEYMKIINENKLYYYMFGFMYDKIIDSVYVLN